MYTTYKGLREFEITLRSGVWYTAKALKLIQASFAPSPERDEILAFIQESDRGIMKGYLNK